MCHYESDVWRSYMFDQLPHETAAELENHLYECDKCLQMYSDLLELHTSQLPIPSDPGPLTEAVMSAVSGSFRAKPASDKWRSLRNYLIAAAATIILMVTGAFNGLLKQVEAFENHSFQRDDTISQKLMEQTVTMIQDSLPGKER